MGPEATGGGGEPIDFLTHQADARRSSTFHVKHLVCVVLLRPWSRHG